MATCEQIDEAGFALGLLSVTEEAAARAHLRTCNRHPDLNNFEAVAVALSLTAEEQQPSHALRDRVLKEAFAERDRRVLRLDAFRFAIPAAAAALLIIVAIAWAAQRGAGPGEEHLFVREFRSDSNIDVRLVADFSQPSTRLTFGGLAALPPGYEYSVWAIRDGTWLKVGAFRPNDAGGWSGEFSFQLTPGDSLCLTGGPPLDRWGDRRDKPLFIERLNPADQS